MGQPVSAGLTSSLANVAHHAASPVTHHAAHIARPVAHAATHVAQPVVSLPALTHSTHVARPVLTHAGHAAGSHFTHPAIHASHIARPVVHGPIYRSGIALHGSPFTAFNKEASAEVSEEEERSTGLTYYRLDNKEEEEKEAEEEERSARLIEDNTSEVLNDLTLEETSQDLIVNPETEVIDLEVEGRTFEEVSSTTTRATTAAATMTPTASIVEKVKEELGEAPKITLEE